MKKIVALALSLIMALALCTTAFAADTVKLYTLDNSSPVATATSISTGAVSDTTSDGKIVSAGYTYYTFGGQYYAPAAKGYATHRIYTSATAYVDVIALGTTLPTVDYTVAEYTLVSAGTCGKETAVNTGATIYKVTNKTTNNWTDDNAKTVWASLDGKLLKVATPAAKTAFVTAAPHSFTKYGATYEKGKIVSVTCDTCGAKAIYSKTLPVGYEDDCVPAAAGMVYGLAVPATLTVPGTGFWYIGTAAAGAAAATTTSPKTFDAGIAMYVGMSLMSIAGSAVVIGKKKEF